MTVLFLFSPFYLGAFRRKKSFNYQELISSTIINQNYQKARLQIIDIGIKTITTKDLI